MDVHRESLLPSSNAYAGIRCYSNKRKTIETDLFPSTGRLLQLPLSCLYTNKLLYLWKKLSATVRCAKSEFKLLLSSSESHQSDKPPFKVYQRG